METNTSTDIATTDAAAQPTPELVDKVVAPFGDLESWNLAQRKAQAISKSTLVPKQFQNNVPNCLVALEMAHRMGASPLMVMQNLYVVNGNPGWSSKFLIASVNASGRFTNLRYDVEGEDPMATTYRVRAWAAEKSTGERLNGSWITWAMVKGEQWDSKTGSKWKTMPEQMFMYRAAAFWQRAYAPEISMGLQTAEEVEDIIAQVMQSPVATHERMTNAEMQDAKSKLENQAITMEMIQEARPNLHPDQVAELAAVKVKDQ